MPPTPEDVAPALLATIREEFTRNLGGRERAALLLEQIQSGAGTYRQANEYAQQVGEALADAFRANLSGSVLPDGRMYWNIADRVVRPMLEQDHDLVAAAAEQVQTALNEAAGLGIKAQAVPLDEARVKGFLDRLASEANYDDVAWILGEPVVNFSLAVVDESIRRNVEFQGRSGLRPRVIRRAEARCCRWCSNLAGPTRVCRRTSTGGMSAAAVRWNTTPATGDGRMSGRSNGQTPVILLQWKQEKPSGCPRRAAGSRARNCCKPTSPSTRPNMARSPSRNICAKQGSWPTPERLRMWRSCNGRTAVSPSTAFPPTILWSSTRTGPSALFSNL